MCSIARSRICRGRLVRNNVPIEGTITTNQGRSFIEWLKCKSVNFFVNYLISSYSLKHIYFHLSQIPLNNLTKYKRNINENLSCSHTNTYSIIHLIIRYFFYSFLLLSLSKQVKNVFRKLFVFRFTTKKLTITLTNQQWLTTVLE